MFVRDNCRQSHHINAGRCTLTDKTHYIDYYLKNFFKNYFANLLFLTD